MEKALTKNPNKDLTTFKDLEKFQDFLNKEPDQKFVRINHMANKAKYLPINVYENMLDELTGGMWETIDFSYSVIANELAGQIVLRYFHPFAKVWVSRTGAAGTPIQMKSERKGGTGDLGDINQKIKNTIVKDLPHLKSECVKNAAKSIAKSFGRDLNRDTETEYVVEALSDQIENFQPRQEEAYDLLDSSPISLTTKENIRTQIADASSKKLDSIIEYLKTQNQKK